MIGELAALGAAISWTASAMLYGKALQQTKPVSANIVRLSCSSAALLAFLIATTGLGSLTNMKHNIVILAAASGIIGLGLGDTLYMLSLKSIGVTRAVPITCTYPLFNLIWAVFFMSNKISPSLILGAIIIFLGIWLLSQEGQAANAQLQSRLSLTGVAAALTASISWSISITIMDRAVTQTPNPNDAFAINVVRTAVIGALLLALSPTIDRHHGFLKMKKKTVAALIAGGIVALGLGWFFLAYSFVQIPEAQAVPISSTTPLFSTLAAIALLHEKVTARNILGSLTVVGGIFLIFLVK
jgi:DME family drug/metabolite transporter